MRVYRSLPSKPQFPKGSALTLGNFDGVHTAHQEMIQHLLQTARSKDVPAGLVTFEPHPISVLKSDVPPFRLTTLAEKLRLLRDAGLDFVCVLPFDNLMRGKTGSEFVEQILHHGLRAAHLIIGHDFQFGYQRSGNADLLHELSSRYHYTVQEMSPLRTADNRIISSSLIRDAIRNGEMEQAAHLLSRPFSITGRVYHGDAKARDLGFPTANLKLRDSIRPRYGVYEVQVTLPERTSHLPAIANIGVRPTLDGSREWLEVHIPNYSGDLYHTRLRVEFLRFIRAEQRFDSVDALRAQIVQDMTALRKDSVC